MSKGLKIGLQLPTWCFVSFEHIRELATRAEALGFDAVFLGDHLYLTEGHERAYCLKPDISRLDMLEAWTTLAGLSRETVSIKLGTAVTPMCLRHPGMLAKMIATVDMMSQGRVICGIGLGSTYAKRELISYGYQWDSFKVRHRKMREGVIVMKKLWTEAVSSYDGEYLHLKGAPFWPKPLQKPHPPVWIAGGSTAVMETAAELGEGWVSSPNLSSEKFKSCVEEIRGMGRKFGRKPDEIEPVGVFVSSIDSDRDVAIKNVVKVRARADSAAWAAQSPEEIARTFIAGTPNECMRRIEVYRKSGVKYVILLFVPVETTIQQLTLFGNTVIPSI